MKAKKEKKEKEQEFYYDHSKAMVVTVRRASDNATLTVDMRTEKGREEARLFCTGTFGVIEE